MGASKHAKPKQAYRAEGKPGKRKNEPSRTKYIKPKRSMQAKEKRSRGSNQSKPNDSTAKQASKQESKAIMVANCALRADYNPPRILVAEVIV